MASKLSKKELSVRDFILKIFRKEIKITTPIFKKFVKIMSDGDNTSIIEKYGERLYSSLLSEYKFKNQDDFNEKMLLFKQNEYLGSGLTQFASASSIILKKLFDSKYVETDWIIEDLGTTSTYATRATINYIFTKEKDNLETVLNTVLQITQYTKNEQLVATLIVERLCTGKNTKLIDLMKDILERELKPTKVDRPSTQSLKNVYMADNCNKKYLPILGKWLYDITEDVRYLPQEAKDIFIF